MNTTKNQDESTFWQEDDQEGITHAEYAALQGLFDDIATGAKENNPNKTEATEHPDMFRG